MRAEPVSVEIIENGVRGHGEALPYPRYGETVETVTATIEQLRGAVCAGMSRADLQTALPPGAARCALDCALWDLEAKTKGTPVWQLAQMPRPRAIITAFTVFWTGQTPWHMRPSRQRISIAENQAGQPRRVLADVTRLREIRQIRPDAKLIVDANEGWRVQELAAMRIYWPHMT